MEPHTELLKVEHFSKHSWVSTFKFMRWDAAQTHSVLIFKCDEDAAQVNIAIPHRTISQITILFIKQKNRPRCVKQHWLIELEAYKNYCCSYIHGCMEQIESVHALWSYVVEFFFIHFPGVSGSLTWFRLYRSIDLHKPTSEMKWMKRSISPPSEMNLAILQTLICLCNPCTCCNVNYPI